MIDFNYESQTRIVFGKEAIEKVGENAAEFARTKTAMIVYGGSPTWNPVTTGLYGRVEKSLTEKGFSCIAQDGVVPNPRIDLVRKAVVTARENNVGIVIAIGGGSAIDTAKGIASAYYYDGDPWDLWCGKGDTKDWLPTGAVLTMSATGSETSMFTVMTNDETVEKIGYGGPTVRPKFAIMNPEVTYSLPKYQTACGACDMIAHVLDQFWTRVDNVDVSNGVELGLVKAIMKVTPIALENPNDYNARAELMLAGSYAMNGYLAVGRATNIATHTMAEDLGAVYDVVHGAVLAVLQPACMKFYSRTIPDKFLLYAKEVFGLDTTDEQWAIDESIRLTKEMFKSWGLPTTMKELGIDIDKDGEKIAARIPYFDKPYIYCTVTKEDVLEIYNMCK